MNYKKNFPIFERRANEHPLVYLDSAATTQKPKQVINSITNFYEKYNANVKRGIYPLAGEATKMVEDTRKKVAKFIGAKSKDEIIFTKNTTEAINLLAYSMSHNIYPRDIITTTVLEHHSNFVPWQMLSARTSSLLEVLNISDNFQLSLSNLRRTKVLAITHVSNVLGNKVDIKKIIKKARLDNPNIIVVVDAAQSVSRIPIDVRSLDCDFLAFSGHKMFAGSGVGVLYGKKERLKELDPFLFGGQMIEEVSIKKTTFRNAPDKFEAGTMPVADIISLGTAIDYIGSIGFKDIQEHEQELTAYCLEKLKEVDNLHILGPRNLEARIGVISFVVDGIHPHDIAQILGDNNICVRAGHHCAMPLHKRLGVSSSVRVSLSIYNDRKDIEYFLAGLKKAIRTFK